MTQRASIPQYLNLLAAIICGVLLRWMMLGHGIWRDEASSYFDAIGGTWHTVTSRVAFSELNPPGYFLFMHYWMKILPVNDFTLKLPSLLASLLLIPLAWIAGRHVGGARVSVVAAWFAALAPIDLYYTQEARPYMFAAAFVITAIIGLCELIEQTLSVRAVILFAIGTIGVLLMQYTGGIFDIALYAAWSFVRAKGWMRTPLAPVFGIGLVLLTMVASMVPSVVMQVHAGLSWAEHPQLLQYPEMAVRDLFATLPLEWLPKHQICKVLFAVAILLEGLWVWKKQRGFEYPGGRNAVMLGLIVISVAILQIPISNHGRYMAPFAPLSWLCIAAWLVCGFTGTEQRRKIGVIASIIVIASIAVVDLQTEMQQAGTVKSGAALLQELHGQNGLNPADWSAADTTLLVAPDLFAPTVAYYLRNQKPMMFGFARWDNPQNFSPIGYSELWNSPDAVLLAEQRIEKLHDAGVKHLILISQAMNHAGDVRFERNNELVQYLHSRYHSAGVVTLTGTLETFNVENLTL